jgi:hypothetical protein
LVVDTNILGKQDFIPKFVLERFRKALADIRGQADVNVTVPWLVLEEVVHHKASAMVEACAGAAKANYLLGYPRVPDCQQMARIAVNEGGFFIDRM